MTWATAKVVLSLFPNQEGVFVAFMALILLPDDCSPPETASKKKRSREGEVAQVAKSNSAASLSSRSSYPSTKGSGLSTASSKSSFAPLKADPEDGKRVRIAIGGA